MVDFKKSVSNFQITHLQIIANPGKVQAEKRNFSKYSFESLVYPPLFLSLFGTHLN
jgi:hypothetical protein